MILRIILFNELEDFLPQGGVRRRPKKVPLSFSALARGALQAPGCAEDRHSPPAGLPEGRRRQWCARRIDDERTWVKQRDTKGSWIVDRGSWIEDPKCPVLPGILIQGQSGISGILAVSDLQSHHRAGGNHPRSFWDPLLHIKLGFQATTLLKRGT